MVSAPRRPADVGWRALMADILVAYQEHAARLVHARYGIGDPLAAGELAGHALAALATQHAMAERVLASRWCNARDALVYGASLDEVAAGMGLDVDEVAAGLRSWVDGQQRHCGMTAAEADEVAALLDRAEGADR